MYVNYDENGLRHCEDGPAVKLPNGTQKWYKHGVLHRENGPAVIKANGHEEYYENGKLIKKNQIYIAKDGNFNKTFYLKPHFLIDAAQTTKGFTLHSVDDEPSVVLKNGTKKWHSLGRLHRHNKPAIIKSDKSKYYYRFGKRHSYNGKAAVQEADGTKKWYRIGKLHREKDRPAIIHSNGDKEWFINGRRHRENGPAIENFNGKEFYYLFGKKLTKRQFEKELGILQN